MVSQDGAVQGEERNAEIARNAIPEEMDQDGAIGKSVKSRADGVSMMDHFTPEQVREHIASLRQWADQILTLFLPTIYEMSLSVKFSNIQTLNSDNCTL